MSVKEDLAQFDKINPQRQVAFWLNGKSGMKYMNG